MVTPLVFKLGDGEYLAVRLAREPVTGQPFPAHVEARWWRNHRKWHDVSSFELERLQLTIGLQVICRFCTNGLAPDLKSTCLQCKGSTQHFDPLASTLAFGKVLRTARLMTPADRRWFFHAYGHPWSNAGADDGRLELDKADEEARAVELERREHVADEEHTRAAYVKGPRLYPWDKR